MSRCYIAARRRTPSRAILLCGAFLASAPASATPTVEEAYALHGQATFVEQASDRFASPYRGPNSLSPAIARETFDATLYAGLRLAPGVEAWLSPEVDQGFGLDDTLGMAGFPSGEAYKVGRQKPYLRLPRAFVRGVFAERGPVTTEAGPLQLQRSQAAQRVVVTIGKFSVTDVFDASGVAHDPRGDFLNWSAIDAPTFDYAADAWGYTVGAAIEDYRGAWVLRAGVFDLSSLPNSAHLTSGARQYEGVAELEHRHASATLEGRALVTLYANRARMARLEDALASAGAGGGLDLAPLRRRRTRDGVSLLVEQGIAAHLVAFARAGIASGDVEAYEFTDVDRSASLGLSASGERWHREGDGAGVVAIRNEISAARARYLAAGGLGILVGDGRLPNAGPEKIWEAYYRWSLGAQHHLTLDWQHATNPAYNRDRGPVNLLALRVHAQF